MRRTLSYPYLMAIALFASPVSASEGHTDRSWWWSNGASLGTEYVWRGQSLTEGNPSLVGELKLEHRSGTYVGVWGGNLDLGPDTDTHVELDYFAGWAKKMGKVYFNAGYLYRYRPSDTLSLDFGEFALYASYDFGGAVAGVGTTYAWDYFQGGHSIYYSANLRVPLGKPHDIPVSAIVTIGDYNFSNRTIGDYRNFDLRLSVRRKSWYYSVGYSNTDIDPETSGLLTANESDGRWRLQALVMF